MSMALPDEDELLAAEMAFDLLDPAERAAAAVRLDRDTAFADAHARWQAYAAALFTGPGEAPRPSVWAAIEARLPANDTTQVAASRSLRWWRLGALTASAAAVVLGVIAFQKPETNFVRVPAAQVLRAPIVAVLTGKTGLVTVSFDPSTRRVTAAANGLAIGDHSLQLWVIPVDGKPRSMGVMNASTPSWVKVPLPASAALAAGVTIAVSVEPIGGSPTGQPTGPVILTGKMTAT